MKKQISDEINGQWRIVYPHYQDDPIIKSYLEDLYVRLSNRLADVTLDEVDFLFYLTEDEWLDNSTAANHIYKIQERHNDNSRMVSY